MIGGELVLEGIVGSTAYGLAREGSDEDRLGVFVAPTRDLLKFNPPQESIQQHDPDAAYHELRKYLSLALKCNPTITELLWLPDELYTVRKAWGNALIRHRTEMLSAPLVQSAYGGYALSQIQRLKRREDDGSLANKDPKRIAKHARHCMRLMHQGIELLTYGRLTVRVPNPQYYWDLDNVSLEGLEFEFSELDHIMKNEIDTVLPEQPNREAVEQMMLDIREWGK